MRFSIFAAGIIGVVGYGKMAVLAFEAWPGLLFWPTAASHIVIVLGIASLIDNRQS